MKTILRQTETLAVIKVSGTNVTETITLGTDLLSSTMVVSGTPTVNISHVQWNISNTVTDTITVTRGGVAVLNLYINASQIDMSGNGGFADTVGNTSDLVVQITGTGQLYLTVRKVSGYASKIEPWRYGSYDNTAAVGS